MDNIQTVQMIQDYIKEHFGDNDFCIKKVCSAIGYSRRHADRLFKTYLKTTLHEYINAVCLTNGAMELKDTKQNVLEIALNSHFQSHEGFTRSFAKRFHITPQEYREKKIPIRLFIQYSISHYFVLLKNKEEQTVNNELKLCMITAKERPKRKLIYLRSHKAKDYLSYCEEVGCEWEGLLNSIEEKFDTAALIELPDFLVEGGFSKIAAGIEVPINYNKPLPQQYKIAELSECTMLYFQSEPYEKQEHFGIAIESVYAAVNKYKPELYGYKFAYDKAPSFNLGAQPETGGKLAIPAVKL